MTNDKLQNVEDPFDFAYNNQQEASRTAKRPFWQDKYAKFVMEDGKVIRKRKVSKHFPERYRKCNNKSSAKLNKLLF